MATVCQKPDQEQLSEKSQNLYAVHGRGAYICIVADAGYFVSFV